MAEKTIKKSENIAQIVGELLELNLEVQDRKNVELVNWTTGKKETVPNCKVVTRKDFRNPSLLISCKRDDVSTTVGVMLSDVNEFVLDDNGFVKDNPDFKGRLTILEDYVCKTTAQEGTRVHIDYSMLKANEYVTKDTFEYKVYQPNITAYNVSSTGVPSEDIFEGKVTGYISKIIDEVRGEENEETGRIKVTLCIFDKPDNYFPVDFIVEKDLADDFKDTFSVNDNASVSYEIIRKRVGGKPISSDGRKGRRTSRVTSGFDVTEYSIFDFGEEPIDEENQYFISKKEMGNAKKERDIKIKAKIDKKKQDVSKPKVQTGLGGTTIKASESVDDIFPDVEDDDPF